MQTPGQNRNSVSSRLLLVGASVRAAAESARRAGFSVTAMDHFGDRETIESADRWISLPSTPQIGDWRDALTPKGSSEIAIVGGLQSGYRWLAGIPYPFRGATPSWFEKSEQPKFLRQLAEEAKVRFPETIRSVVPRGKSPEGQWLSKDLRSSGGLGVRIHDSTTFGPADSRTCLQRRIRGAALGATYVGLGDRALLLGLCRSLKKRFPRRPFVFAGAVGPVSPNQRCRESLQRLGDVFAAQSRISGPFNIDVVFDGCELWLMEVNPRWSGSMEIVERAWMRARDEPVSMFDSPDDWIERLETTLRGVDNDPRTIRAWVKRVLFATRDVRLNPSDFETKFADARWEWKDVPRRQTEFARYEPIATMITSLDRMSLRQVFRVKL